MKKSTPQIPLLKYFQTFIHASINGRRLTPSGKRITNGTNRG
jgi:hypothetical protein